MYSTLLLLPAILSMTCVSHSASPCTGTGHTSLTAHAHTQTQQIITGRPAQRCMQVRHADHIHVHRQPHKQEQHHARRHQPHKVVQPSVAPPAGLPRDLMVHRKGRGRATKGQARVQGGAEAGSQLPGRLPAPVCQVGRNMKDTNSPAARPPRWDMCEMRLQDNSSSSSTQTRHISMLAISEQLVGQSAALQEQVYLKQRHFNCYQKEIAPPFHTAHTHCRGLRGRPELDAEREPQRHQHQHQPQQRAVHGLKIEDDVCQVQANEPKHRA